MAGKRAYTLQIGFLAACFLGGIIAGSGLQHVRSSLRSGRKRQTIYAHSMPLRMEAVKRAIALNRQEYEFIISAPPPAR